METSTRLTAVVLTCALLGLVPGGQAHAAARSKVPGWAKDAVNYLAEQGWLDKKTFEPNAAMPRKDFRTLMEAAFGGGYRRTKGKITAGEVNATLVRVLDRRQLAEGLQAATSPDGWSPEPHGRFGTEIVARELGLRFNRPTEEEDMEASAAEKIRQADIAYSVWKAITAPSTYSADSLAGFTLGNYTRKQRKVVRFALSLAGSPYVWGGEWIARTPTGYPYGAQQVGGFDCSGFIWYVLQAKTDSYSPANRPYKGWSIPERSSSQMAAAVGKKDRLGYKRLRAGDVILFAPNGRDSKARDVYHAGLYLGEGWMVHSSGSRAGVSISSVAPGTWWHGQILWGRRIIG